MVPLISALKISQTLSAKSHQTLATFQKVVSLLRMTEYRCYVEAICSCNMLPACSGRSRVYRVRLSSGRTEKGRAVLDRHDGETRAYLDSQTA
jgi:hypothetical protein